MSINGISSGNINIPQLNPVNSPNQTGDSDGDNDGGRVSGSSGASSRGGLASAISQALSAIGVSGATPTPDSSSSTDQDPLKALSTFIHSLFAALQSQGSGQPAAAQGGSNSNVSSDSTSVSAATGHGHHHHGGGAGSIGSKLQSLIQELAASGSDTTGATQSDPALAALQQSFQNLLNVQGGSGNQATLGSFLQTLVQDLPGANPVGNIVSTQA
jgi:hypothetical protein